MPSKRQSQQLSAANAKLEQIQGIISAAIAELRQLQANIKLNRRRHDAQIVRLRKLRVGRKREMRKEFEDLSMRLQGKVILLRRAIKECTAEKGVIEYEIAEAKRNLERQRREYKNAAKDDVEKLAKLKDNVERTTETLSTRTAELEEIDTKLELTNRRRIRFEKLLVQVEEAYATRSTDLRKLIRDAEEKLARTERMIQEYEKAAVITREADEARTADLEKREGALAAGKRALSQQRADFEAEKKRFYQTKSL